MLKYQALLMEVVRKHKMLSLGGFNNEDYGKVSGDSFAVDRRKMVAEEEYAEAFDWSIEFLKNVPKQILINGNFSTYVLKDLVREYCRQRASEIYVPDGIFIAAAYASGFRVKRLGMTAYINANINNGPEGHGIYLGKTKFLDA